MRKLSLAGLIVTGFIAAAALIPGQAQAIPLAAAPGSLATVDTSGAEKVQYGCRRVWRCGRWGCGWRRVCRGPRYGGPYFGFAAPGFGVYVGPRRPYRNCYWRYGRRYCR